MFPPQTTQQITKMSLLLTVTLCFLHLSNAINDNNYNKNNANYNSNNNKNKNNFNIMSGQQNQAPYSEKKMQKELCDYPCKPCGEVRCLDGVNEIIDGCGCCTMCARQQGDLCTQQEKCDTIKDLYCEMVVDGGNRGICKVKNGRSCNIQSKVVKDGDTVNLNCSMKCYCQDGKYACTTLCPQELRRPSPTHCKDAQLVAIKNRCCKEWVCPHPHNLLNPDEPFGQAYNNDNGCKKHVAKWSACDKPCGYGESVRLTNDNDQCQTEKEVRICKVRPCGLSPDLSSEAGSTQNTSKRCRATVTMKTPVHLKHADCISTSVYNIKYCAQCKRCCGPEIEETREVEMLCGKEKKSIRKKFMFIEKCTCIKGNDQTCPFE